MVTWRDISPFFSCSRHMADDDESDSCTDLDDPAAAAEHPTDEGPGRAGGPRPASPVAMTPV